MTELTLSNSIAPLEVRTSEGGCNELYCALVAAQSTISAAIADKENTYHKSKYADLASVFDAIRPSFAEHGIGVMQFPFTRSGSAQRSYREAFDDGRKTHQRPVYETIIHNEGDPERERTETIPILEVVPVIYVTVRTRLIHSSGQWIEQDLEVPVSVGANPAQAIGIATTYLKRYALQAMAGVPSDDDDGNGLNDHSPNFDQNSYPQSVAKPSAKANTRRQQAPARPQGAEGRLNAACNRLRESENLFTLRALYEASVKKFEVDGTDKDLAELEKVKDEVKLKLTKAEAEAHVGADTDAAQNPAPARSTRNPSGGINF